MYYFFQSASEIYLNSRFFNCSQSFVYFRMRRLLCPRNGTQLEVYLNLSTSGAACWLCEVGHPVPSTVKIAIFLLSCWDRKPQLCSFSFLLWAFSWSVAMSFGVYMWQVSLIHPPCLPFLLFLLYGRPVLSLARCYRMNMSSQSPYVEILAPLWWYKELRPLANGIRSWEQGPYEWG